jgi:hypothetical protein
MIKRFVIAREQKMAFRREKTFPTLCAAGQE